MSAFSIVYLNPTARCSNEALFYGPWTRPLCILLLPLRLKEVHLWTYLMIVFMNAFCFIRLLAQVDWRAMVGWLNLRFTICSVVCNWRHCLTITQPPRNVCT